MAGGGWKRFLTRPSEIPLRGNKAVTAVELLGAATSIVLFLGAVIDLFGEGPLWSTILVVWLLIITTTVIALLVLQERRVSRRLRYAAALNAMHQSEHLIRDAEAAILNQGASVDLVVPVLRQALTSVARTFTLVTGAPCRACVKEVHYPEDAVVPVGAETLRGLKVSTLCRDGTGPHTTHADELEHYVTDNTDFELLFMRRWEYPWYHSNDLSEEITYKNSSWEKGFPRAYNATCVWPIQKTAESGDLHDTLGFLCVDSLDTDIFEPRFDFHVGAAIADSLYPLLKLMRLRADELLVSPGVNDEGM